jgi:hypothetical protein
MKMVTEWYRALSYRICPRSRLLNFHEEGTGFEARNLALNVAISERIRAGIRDVIAGADPLEAADLQTKTFHAQARERGFTDRNLPEKNMYKAFQQGADHIHYHVGRWPHYAPAVTGSPIIDLKLGEDVLFHSEPLGTIVASENEIDLYHVAVKTRWDATMETRFQRDFRLLSELVAIQAAYPNMEVRRSVVDIIIPENRAANRIIVPFDAEWTKNWRQQIWAQESSIQRDLVTISDPNDRPLMLNVFFPQHGHACDFPYPCQFRDTCWANRQLTDANFRRRKPEDFEQVCDAASN